MNVFKRVSSIRRVFRKFLPDLICLALLTVAGWAMWKYGRPLREADTAGPLAMPENGEVDHRFDFPAPWDMVRIPTATRFDPPLGTEHLGLVYNAQKFWDVNEARGGHHTGDDLNGIGGMNTDLGDPVFATADGLVLYAGEPSSGWGKVIVIGHRTVDGRRLDSMYAHLDRMDVGVGELVARGGRIGLVGTANGHYPAHLHFEIRAGDGVDIGPGYAMDPLDRLDPLGTVDALRNAAADDLAPSPLGRMLESRKGK